MARIDRSAIEIVLDAEALSTLRAPVIGSGRFQAAIRRLQERVSVTGNLTLRHSDLLGLRRLSNTYRRGTHGSLIRHVIQLANKSLHVAQLGVPQPHRDQATERSEQSTGSEKVVPTVEGHAQVQAASLHLDELPMSTRLRRALHRAGFVVMGDVTDRSQEELLAIKNLGRKSHKELATLIARAIAGEFSPGAIAVVGAPAPIAVSADSILDDPTRQLIESDSDAPIPTLTRHLYQHLTERELFVLISRLDFTLEEVGEVLNVTRERVRQIERKARAKAQHVVLRWVSPFESSLRDAISAVVVTEELLWKGFFEPSVPSRIQGDIARVALSFVFPTAEPIGNLWGRRLSDLWSLDRSGFIRRLRRLSNLCPIEEADMGNALARVGLPQSPQLQSFLLLGVGPVRYHEPVASWVRGRAYHRDAAVALLRKEVRPLSAAEIADRLGGLSARAASANFVRDARFRQLKPSGAWTLAEFASPEDNAEAFGSTVDAVVAVLTDHGPLPRRELIRRVMDVYPVSAWAISNALDSSSVGLTSDGQWDLCIRGASPRQRPTPKRPDSVAEDHTGRIIVFKKPVDSELLRGSGVPIHAYIAWKSGATHAGDRCTFRSQTFEPIEVRRGFGSANMSSLRPHALRLGAAIGDILTITLELHAGEYHITKEQA